MTSRLLRAGVQGWKGGLSFPNALTTGPAAGGYTNLTPAVTQEVRNSPYPPFVQELESGALLIEGYALTGELDIYADNVIMTGCSVTVTGGGSALGVTLRGSGPYSLSYCQISGADPSANRVSEAIDVIGSGDATITSCNLYWCSKALETSGSATGVTFARNYCHDIGYQAGDHSENIFLAAGVSGITVTGNTILNPLTQTACIFSNGSVTDCTFSGNLFGGGGYALYAGSGGSSTGVAYEGNWFSTAYYPNCGEFGVIYTASYPTWGSNGNVWSGNAWYDGRNAGQAIAAP